MPWVSATPVATILPVDMAVDVEVSLIGEKHVVKRKKVNLLQKKQSNGSVIILLIHVLTEFCMGEISYLSLKYVYALERNKQSSYFVYIYCNAIYIDFID